MRWKTSLLAVGLALALATPAGAREPVALPIPAQGVPGVEDAQLDPAFWIARLGADACLGHDGFADDLGFLVDDTLAPCAAHNESPLAHTWKHCVARRFVEKFLEPGISLQKTGLSLVRFFAHVLFGRLSGERGKANRGDAERSQSDVVDFRFNNFRWFVISMRLFPLCG